ncbi:MULTISPECIES: hypothetical protein [unclassified Streptomyces]|uniref:hypothetical protein n=1 Tax=unclassified Streptomyces TaxID=2593676 RepID=UPI000A95852A|nr:MULTISPECIES: hypothetical protein [unclassified Streptomyces]MCD2465408.1 hypothetical protein [Streptomyces sp. MBT42]
MAESPDTTVTDSGAEAPREAVRLPLLGACGCGSGCGCGCQSGGPCQCGGCSG